MKPLVIFEGPDGAGKTTLARACAKKWGAIYTHHGAYPDANVDQLRNIYLNSMLPALQGVAPVVLDRCWISEPIYADALDRFNRCAYHTRRMLEHVMVSVPHLLVVLMPPVEKLWLTVEARLKDELIAKQEQLTHVRLMYDVATKRLDDHVGINAYIDRGSEFVTADNLQGLYEETCQYYGYRGK